LLQGLERAIHSPARLAILSVLFVVERSDFNFLLNQTGLTRGNLSFHLTKLEELEYVRIEKGFSGKVPRTLLEMTGEGRDAFQTYRNRITQALKLLPDE
jgi:DNA-binding transcriptional ArsR family regulator